MNPLESVLSFLDYSVQEDLLLARLDVWVRKSEELGRGSLEPYDIVSDWIEKRGFQGRYPRLEKKISQEREKNRIALRNFDLFLQESWAQYKAGK